MAANHHITRILSNGPLLLVGFSALFGGCANLNQIAKTEQQIPLTAYNDDKKVAESGALYLWPPYSSAAVVDGHGNRCVLTASGSKTIDASADFAFKVGKALEKIEGLDVATKSKLTETLTKLNASGAQSTFLDVALFQLCILDQNGTFKHVDAGGKLVGKSAAVMEAFKQSLDAAKSIP